MVLLHRTTLALLRTRAIWAWAATMLPSHLSPLPVATTQAGLASTNPTSTTVVSAHSLQAEARATHRCPQDSQVPARLLQGTRPLRLDTRLPHQASAALVSARHLQATRLPALSTRLHRRATRPPRLRMVLPLRRRTLQLRQVTHRRRLRTRPRRQATAQPHRRTVAQPPHTTARRHLRTARLRLLTAPRAHSLVPPTTGAHPPRPRRRHTALPARSTLPQAPLATQRTLLRRPSSLLRLRVRHHTRRLRLSGRQQARPTRLHRRSSREQLPPSSTRVNVFM